METQDFFNKYYREIEDAAYSLHREGYDEDAHHLLQAHLELDRLYHYARHASAPLPRYIQK